MQKEQEELQPQDTITLDELVENEVRRGGDRGGKRRGEERTRQDTREVKRSGKREEKRGGIGRDAT